MVDYTAAIANGHGVIMQRKKKLETDTDASQTLCLNIIKLVNFFNLYYLYLYVLNKDEIARVQLPLKASGTLSNNFADGAFVVAVKRPPRPRP